MDSLKPNDCSHCGLSAWGAPLNPERYGKRVLWCVAIEMIVAPQATCPRFRRPSEVDSFEDVCKRAVVAVNRLSPTDFGS